MNLTRFNLNSELLSIILLIFGLLIFATVLFFVWGKIKPQANLTELKTRTKSWWVMSSVFVFAALFNPMISFIAIGFLSFAALRELYSVLNLRESDRRPIFWCYLAVPVQYYLAYVGWYGAFIIFIPVVMFIWIPFMVIIRGEVKGIIQSMAILPSSLMLCVFGISHMAFLLSLPELPGFAAGGRGLLLFVVFITEMNDVFQFTWGKLFGRYKVLPTVSPNKTWEGLIGGILTTTIVGYFLRFLTPLSGMEALLVSFLVAVAGFIGDVVVSAVKRDIGVKDTGSTIPGHGGILDRIDSLATTAPVFFHLVYYLAY